MKKSIFCAALTVIMGLSAIGANAQFTAIATDVKPLMIGQDVPDKMLVDGTGASKSLHSVIGDKPTIIMFYRGDWCTNCINHFNEEIVPNLQKINSLGYNIVFISPDDAEHIRTTAGKINASPSMMYSDAAGELSVAMGIAWQQPERMLERLAEYSGGKNKGFVPVISVFVVGPDKKILFEDVRPDGIRSASRIKGKLLMAVLENLK
ncbi:MAG: redoxin domain-containing protein [Tannerella sp.]|jgi:peroxiredoxin|nr:redoxin domain-containing protein [Tannerella sp.]